jgi:Transposase DDE domain
MHSAIPNSDFDKRSGQDGESRDFSKRILMEPMTLSFGALIAYLNRAIAQIEDPRQASNGRKYSLKDAVLAAFSVFFMQSESFLDYQRHLESHHGNSNAQSLFGMIRVPTVPQIRNIVDGIPATTLSGVFHGVYQALKRGGHLKAFEYLGGLLIALDGTQYFDSQALHCQHCSSRTHKNGTVTYFHSAILPVIVAPGQPQVISLAPEFITPQDGCEKQDCEVAAAKRWITTHGAEFRGQPITFLGDDLYSHQPMCETILDAGMNFIFTCLPTSHTAVYEQLRSLESTNEVKTFIIEQSNKSSKEVYRYRYVNQIALRGTQPALNVNWCELIIARQGDGKLLYENAFITNHELTEESVPLVTAAGRCRWKTENENHNILKTKGYHLEHNFGHGQAHLAASLLSLNVLAFLFHTVLHLTDHTYQQIRQKRGTRKGFFQDIVSLTKYLLFESWQSLIDFMLYGSPPPQTANSS